MQVLCEAKLANAVSQSENFILKAKVRGIFSELSQRECQVQCLGKRKQ
jgi:hypothetical protein